MKISHICVQNTCKRRCLNCDVYADEIVIVLMMIMVLIMIINRAHLHAKKCKCYVNICELMFFHEYYVHLSTFGEMLINVSNYFKLNDRKVMNILYIYIYIEAKLAHL